MPKQSAGSTCQVKILRAQLSKQNKIRFNSLCGQVSSQYGLRWYSFCRV